MEPHGNPLSDALVKFAVQAEAIGLPFLLIGGNAIIHYGVPRFTRDIDFVVPESCVGKWKEFLEQAGMICFHSTDAFLQFAGIGPGLAPVDLMVVGHDTWEKLRLAAVSEEIVEGVSLMLPSPLHLVAMKLQAYRNPARAAREQDWGDIMHLVRRCIPGTSSPEFQQLVVRHGGEAAWARLSRELPSDHP